MGVETAAIVGAVASVAGAAGGLFKGAPKAPKAPPEQFDQNAASLAGARSDALENIQRRSLLSTARTGELGLGSPGTVANKTLLGQ